MEHHSPNIIGQLQANGNAGTVGQVLTSAGPATQVGWQSLGAFPLTFEYTSASALVHTITHNLNSIAPLVSVYEQISGDALGPVSVVATDANTVTITFFVVRAIQGTIVGI